ncbi:lipopolysaccharide biosynthesis protein [uncultured Bacteroides sp.]|uniref:lipopolysaccharide biosynthesis protein n=1 Tax=uncultured Bacteroides sp. TaxID=162156 RepID=UPI0025CEC48E|nr:lipopolysaccharide biosynthesis protein [uncultured Bacteroides sp.]
MSTNLKNSVLSGVFWQYFQRIGNQLVHFVVSIVLARLLMPEDFGTIALVGVFITISNIFIDSGFGNALIQRKEVDDVDCSSIFYLNLAVSLMLYFVIYFAAPLIASFYNITLVCPLLRVQALQIIIMAFYCVQYSLLTRRMLFKKNFAINIIATIISSLVGIGLAFGGCGVWSLVASQLSLQLSVVIGLWVVVQWHPKFLFSWERIKEIFSYSSRILGGQLIIVLCNNVYNIVIGKRYSAVDLGLYNRGQLLPTTVVDNAATSINSVMFPALSKLQDAPERHLSVFRRTERMIAFLVFLLVAILLPLSKDLIYLLLGEKWLPATPFMQLVCLTVCFNPFYLLNQALQTSLGRSDLFFRTTFIAKSLSVGIILVGSMFSVYIMVAAGCVASLFTLLVSSIYNKKLENYSICQLFSDIIPSALTGVVSGVVVAIITNIGLHPILNIVLGGLTGLCVYLCIAYCSKNEALIFILNIMKKYKK